MQLLHDPKLDKKPKPSKDGDSNEANAQRRVCQPSLIGWVFQIRYMTWRRLLERTIQVHRCVRIDCIPQTEKDKGKRAE